MALNAVPRTSICTDVGDSKSGLWDCLLVTEVREKPQTPEERFAHNVRVMREAQGWNQSEMARRLTDAGLEGFHQTTVSRIEKGERPVKLGEATVIAGVFHTPVERLAGDIESVQQVGVIRAAQVHATQRREELEQAAERFELAVRALREAIGDPRPDDQSAEHSPWRIVPPEGGWSAGKRATIVHDGFGAGPDEVANARRILTAGDARAIHGIVNMDAQTVVQLLNEPPF